MLTEIHINEDEVRYYNGKNVFYIVEKYAKPAYIMDRISDMDFIEKMLICNAYLPHKERLMAMFYNVQKYSEEEFKKHLNLENINNNPEMLKIKDGQTETTLNMRNDLFDSKIVSAFDDDLKRTIEFYLNKNK